MGGVRRHDDDTPDHLASYHVPSDHAAPDHVAGDHGDLVLYDALEPEHVGPDHGAVDDHRALAPGLTARRRRSVCGRTVIK
jgi:hypothetical protein